MAYIQDVLTLSQLNQKRNSVWSGTQYLSISDPTVIFQATVNLSSFDNLFSEVNYTQTTGHYSVVKTGMTVYIGENFVGWIRQPASSTTLYINETDVKISVGDVIKVVDDYRAHDIFKHMVNGVKMNKWDKPYQGLRPMIRNLPSVRVGWVSESTDNKLQLSFTPTAYPAEHEATIDNKSWQWELPTGVTIQTGTLKQPNITVRCEPGEHWLHISVADDREKQSIRHIKVFAHDRETFPPEIVTDEISIEMTLDSGVNATIPSFVGIDNIEEGALVTVWTDYTYDNVVVEPRIDSHGRLYRTVTDIKDNFQHHTIPQNTIAQIMGIAGQISLIEMQKMEIKNTLEPNMWGEINRPTLWRTIWHILDHYTTITTLHEIAFDNLSDRFIHPTPFTVGGEQLLMVLNNLLSTINGGLQFSTDGVIQCVRDGRWLPESSRDSLGIVMSWDEHDTLGYNFKHKIGNNVGLVEAYGVSWDITSQTSTSFSTLIQGLAFGQGDRIVSLSKQVLSSNVSSNIAQRELIERAGHEYAYYNGNDILTVNLPNSYSDLTPARNIWHIWTLDELRPKGKRWLLTRLTYHHNNKTGTRTVQAIFEIETAKHNTQTYISPPNDIDNIIPTSPPFDVYPAFSEMLDIAFPSNDPIHILRTTSSQFTIINPLRDGNVVMTWNDFDVWLTDEYKKSNNPSWTRITPLIDADEIITDASFGKEQQGFIVSYNHITKQSRVWRTDFIFNPAHLWEAGQVIDGRFDVLRVASTPNTLYLTGQATKPPINIEWEKIFDFSTGEHDWFVQIGSNPNVSFEYETGIGYRLTTHQRANWSLRIMLNLSPKPIIGGDNLFHFTEITLTNKSTVTSSINVTPPTFGNIPIPVGTGDETLIKTGSVSYGNNYFYVSFSANQATIDNTFVLSKIIFKGTGLNPFEMEPSWSQTFDFTNGTQDFSIQPYTNGQTLEYISGQGFKHIMDVNATRNSRITKLINPLSINDYMITKVRVEFDRDLNWTRGLNIYRGYGSNINTHALPGTMPSFNEIDGWATRAAMDEVSIIFAHQWGSTIPNPKDKWVILRKLTIEGISKTGMGNPFQPPYEALLLHSGDNGETLTVHELGTPPTLDLIGLDTVTIGHRAYIGIDGNILQAENDGEPSTYVTLPSGLDIAGGTVVTPRLKVDGSNNALDEPDLIVASPILTDENEGVWLVTNGGNTLINITPQFNGKYGVINSPNSIAAGWHNSRRIAIIVTLDNQRHLLVWDPVNIIWLDRGILSEKADYIRICRQDSLSRELYFVDGVCYYSPDYGITLSTRTPPDSEIKGIAVYG